MAVKIVDNTIIFPSFCDDDNAYIIINELLSLYKRHDKINFIAIGSLGVTEF
jgi:hypothetical protein